MLLVINLHTIIFDFQPVTLSYNHVHKVQVYGFSNLNILWRGYIAFLSNLLYSLTQCSSSSCSQQNIIDIKMNIYKNYI